MINTSKALTVVPSAHPFSRLHHYDWLKHSRLGCPSCRSGYVMAVRRNWVEKLLTRQHKYWCQDCGTKFWQKD